MSPWVCHVGIGLGLLSTKLAVGRYLHRGISYPVVVLVTREVGSPGGRVHNVAVGLTSSLWGPPHPPRNSPPSFVAPSSVLLASVPLPGSRLEVFPSKSTHPS